MTDTDATLTPKELAERWGTTPKAVRRFMRANTDDRAGKGGRWLLTEADADALEAKFRRFGGRAVTTFTMRPDDADA